jgi:dGTPase
LHQREQIEKREDERLAPYGLRSGSSLGRLRSEPRHRYRTDFQRDRDRVLHSRAFRRLQYKTQVFPSPFHKGDHVRNRLTHTLEVAQIARTAARALGANEDLVEAIVLAHDLGHPPFGHAGEKILNELLRAHGGFEHNRQSLRIVDFIERRSNRYRGLNLTHETRAGLLKHGADYPRYTHPVPLPKLGRQASVESQLANLADEIAYHSHDLDDGLRSGLLDWDGLCQLELWRRALDGAGVEGLDDEQLLRSRVIIRVIDLLASDLIETSAERLANSGASSPHDVLSAESPLVGFSERVRRETRAVARYLFENFYRHPEVIRMTDEAERILRALWQAYLQDPAQLPPQVIAEGSRDGLERAMADYVAGMTDRFAMDEHARLCVATPCV